jgi:methanogenic corrinoid protein MtbC1
VKSQFEARRGINDPLAALPAKIGDELVGALRDAAELEMPALFVDVVRWAQTMLAFRDAPPDAMANALDAISKQLGHVVPARSLETARVIIDASHAESTIVDTVDAPAISESTSHGKLARSYLTNLLEGHETRGAHDLLLAFANGTSATELAQYVLTPVLHESGRLWQRNEIGISEAHMVTHAVERVAAQIMHLSRGRSMRDLTVVTAALHTDGHDVGLRMVADAFALDGWQAIHLGGRVPAEDLLEYVDRISVDVLALSATRARDVRPVRDVISELEQRPVAPLVLVGGRAFSLHPSMWRLVGADGFAKTPLLAVALANDLVSHSDS